MGYKINVSILIVDCVYFINTKLSSLSYLLFDYQPSYTLIFSFFPINLQYYLSFRYECNLISFSNLNST